MRPFLLRAVGKQKVRLQLTQPTLDARGLLARQRRETFVRASSAGRREFFFARRFATRLRGFAPNEKKKTSGKILLAASRLVFAASPPTRKKKPLVPGYTQPRYAKNVKQDA